jgi:hypothetical protein
VARAGSYEVSFGEDGAEPATVEVAEPCFAPPPLAPLTTYRWQVTAVTATGRRAEGPPWSFTTEAPAAAAAGAPRDPAPADGEVGTSRLTVLSWAAPEPPASAYAIYLWPAGEARPALPLAAGWTATSYQPPPLECGRAYRWQVLARSSGESAETPGEEWGFTVRGRPFRRGDADANGSLNITDPIRILNYLFSGGEAPSCLETADGDASGSINITDPIYLLGFLFQGGPGPPAPFPDCACAPEESALACDLFTACP